MRKMLRNDQWERTEDLLPGKASDRGVAAKDNRLFVEPVLWLPALAAHGATYRRNWAICMTYIRGSHGGARPAYGSASSTALEPTQTSKR